MSKLKINKLNHLVIIVLICSLGYLSIGLFSPKAGAFTMSNDNWILKLGNFNVAAGKPTSDKYKVALTVGQTSPGLFTGTNYKVRSGFQYISSIIRFSFTISSTSIDFGILSPTNPVTRTNTLTVSNGSAYGYLVTASENHPLQAQATSAIIPDTSCDNGSCNATDSADWAHTLTYGFGYRCDNVTGTDCANGFSDKTAYKRFANAVIGETATVMSGKNVGRNKKATITYKINVATTQTAGTYSNVITYIATPTF